MNFSTCLFIKQILPLGPSGCSKFNGLFCHLQRETMTGPMAASCITAAAISPASFIDWPAWLRTCLFCPGGRASFLHSSCACAFSSRSPCAKDIRLAGMDSSARCWSCFGCSARVSILPGELAVLILSGGYDWAYHTFVCSAARQYAVLHDTIRLPQPAPNCFILPFSSTFWMLC
jgi:hypothetical protein